MVEQNRSGAYTEFVYAPTGFKMQIMNGQTATTLFVPLPSGGQAVYNATGLLYYHPDHLGSTRLISDTNRNIHYDGAYAPFGEPYAQSGTADLSFTGQRQDTVAGLYDFPAREYSYQGRWPSPDPAGRKAVSLSDPQTWNRDAYVANNPLRFVDRTGLYLLAAVFQSWTSFGGGGGGIILGNDIFDAIAGAPGTYLSLNMYGQMSFGFSERLWSATQNFLDQNPSLRGSAGLQVLAQDLGAQQVTSGLVPEYLSLAQERSQVLTAMPQRFADDMAVAQDNLVQAGVDSQNAGMQALAFEVKQMQTWFSSEPDAANWLNMWKGLNQDLTGWMNRWSPVFPRTP